MIAYSDELLELCPICEGDEDGCAWCDGYGLVEHSCTCEDCEEA